MLPVGSIHPPDSSTEFIRWLSPRILCKLDGKYTTLKEMVEANKIKGALKPIKTLQYLLLQKLKKGPEFNIVKLKNMFKGKIVSLEDIDQILG
ncbi:MAG: hypothetical protein ACP6IP_10315 [Candidatus Njordarchaeia archaeon]